jgi:aromatic-amino-acid transaminase
VSDTFTVAPSVATGLGLLPSQPADALLALIGMHHRDPRPDKIDLGVGVYRDATGRTPVMRAVKAAETRLLREQDTKAYLGPEGDIGFVQRLARVVFGVELAETPRLTGVQTPGGTGALRLGAELVARATPGARVWIGTPSWPNHAPIFSEAGLEVVSHPYFDAGRSDLDFAAMMAAIGGMARGDVLLIHGCCHNPTGADLSGEQWCQLTDWVADNGVLPFVDLAYQGLGDGLDRDAAGLRMMLQAVPEALVAYSCDKNFGLYRDRVGALWVQAAGGDDARRIGQTMLVLARSLWSMPPDHGAAVVRLILEDEALAAAWREELDAMRLRINTLRALLAAHPRLAPIGRQRGMFAMLPIAPEAVLELRAHDGIYMAGSGRINVAGLREDTIPRLVAALRPYLGDGRAAASQPDERNEA